jgi:hypothetical protein
MFSDVPSVDPDAYLVLAAERRVDMWSWDLLRTTLTLGWWFRWELALSICAGQCCGYDCCNGRMIGWGGCV